MSIPFYFVDPEKLPPPGGTAAQLGYGFEADGALRLPQTPRAEALCVFDDRHLPEQPAPLDGLRPFLTHGVLLDFERAPTEQAERTAAALRRLCPPDAPFFAPQRLSKGLAGAIPVVCPERMCNCWEELCARLGARLGRPWALELIPAERTCALPCRGKRHISPALCVLEDGRYFDTRATLRQKAEAAERSGCKAVFVLRQDFARLKP